MAATTVEPEEENEGPKTTSEMAIPDFIDSSGDEGGDDKKETGEQNEEIDVSKISLSAETKKKLKQIADKAKLKTNNNNKPKRKNRTKKERRLTKQKNRSVIYVKCLPWGFFESQLREFFEQFGDISRLRLCRSKKGRTQHMAFIEFLEKDVGPIAAESFDGIILGGKIVKAESVPPEKVKMNMFKGYGRKGKKTQNWEQQRAKEAEKNKDANHVSGKKRKRVEKKFKKSEFKKLRVFKKDYEMVVRTSTGVKKVLASRFLNGEGKKKKTEE